MRIVLLLLFFVLSPFAAMAQVPGITPDTETTSSDAGIDELIRIIENDETRAVLIERLKQAGAEDPAPAEDVPPDLSIVRQLAEYTKAAAEGTSATLRSLGQVFIDLQQGLSGTLDADLEAFRDVAIGVLLVAAGLFGSFLALRIVVLWLQGIIARRVAGWGWVSRILGALASALVIPPTSMPATVTPLAIWSSLPWS